MTATRRQNGGDGATGMGAGLSYEAPGLAFSTRLRGYAWKGGGHGPSLTSSGMSSGAARQGRSSGSESGSTFPSGLVGGVRIPPTAASRRPSAW